MAADSLDFIIQLSSHTKPILLNNNTEGEVGEAIPFFPPILYTFFSLYIHRFVQICIINDDIQANHPLYLLINNIQANHPLSFLLYFSDIIKTDKQRYLLLFTRTEVE